MWRGGWAWAWAWVSLWVLEARRAVLVFLWIVFHLESQRPRLVAGVAGLREEALFEVPQWCM